jgi:hypothetical protein
MQAIYDGQERYLFEMHGLRRHERMLIRQASVAKTDAEESKTAGAATWPIMIALRRLEPGRFLCGPWVDPPDQVWEDYVHQTDRGDYGSGRGNSNSSSKGVV